MADIKIERDFSGALRKTAIAKNIPRAARKLATRWASESVLILKRSAASLQRSGKGRHNGNLFRNIDMATLERGEDLRIAVGTGVGGAKSVVYAEIQDRGGLIVKKDKRLTIPLGDTKGRIANYQGGFWITSRAGNVLYCQRIGKGPRAKIKPLFVLRDQVRLPATHWFSGPMRRQLEALDQTMSPDYVYMQAEVMGQAQGGGER